MKLSDAMIRKLWDWVRVRLDNYQRLGGKGKIPKHKTDGDEWAKAEEEKDHIDEELSDEGIEKGDSDEDDYADLKAKKKNIAKQKKKKPQKSKPNNSNCNNSTNNNTDNVSCPNDS
jgi:hypothetical protein